MAIGEEVKEVGASARVVFGIRDNCSERAGDFPGRKSAHARWVGEIVPR
jgi:hypothetical protein